MRPNEAETATKYLKVAVCSSTVQTMYTRKETLRRCDEMEGQDKLVKVSHITLSPLTFSLHIYLTPSPHMRTALPLVISSHTLFLSVCYLTPHIVSLHLLPHSQPTHAYCLATRYLIPHTVSLCVLSRFTHCVSSFVTSLPAHTCALPCHPLSHPTH